MIVNVWDGSGDKTELEEPDNLFQQNWVTGENLSSGQSLLFKSLEDMLSSPVCAVMSCVGGLNSVLQVDLADGRTVIIRQYTDFDYADHSHYSRRFYAEVGLVKWLAVNTRVPVPSLITMSEPTKSVPLPFMVMSKLPGGTAFEMLTRMSLSAKKNLISSCVDIAIELFRCRVPQLIGSTAADSSGNLQVIPLVNIRADRVFHSLKEYMDFLFTRKRQAESMGTTDAEKARALATLDDLQALVLRQMETLARPDLHRCVLVHDDLSAWNVLTDINGNVTGVIDWEFHSLQPAILAVGYPTWLSYSGPFDPRFVLENGSLQTWWLVSREESQELINHYYEVAMAKDTMYHEVLKQGEFLRTVVLWLKAGIRDPGFDFMRTWMAEEIQARKLTMTG